MRLSVCETIVDENKFVESHEATIQRNTDNEYFEPYKERYNKFKQLKQADADKQHDIL